MKSRWAKGKSAEFVARIADARGEDLALRTYTSRLLGAEKELVLHGGGNTSVKSTVTNLFGDTVPAIFVKASGHDLAAIEPEGHSGMDLEGLRRLRDLSTLSDDAMVNELRTKLFDARAATPSIEALLHVFIPAKFIDHTHADAILALTNQRGGEEIVRDALGDDVLMVDYVKPGFALAKAAATAFDESPESSGIVLMKHGLVTWGEDARESYGKTIELVTKAEAFLAANAKNPVRPTTPVDSTLARERYVKLAPVLRGLLAVRTEDPDRPYRRFILRPLVTDEVLELLDSDRGKDIVLTPPLTTDHLIRTKALPLWVDAPRFDDDEKLKSQLAAAIREYARQYDAYVARHSKKLSSGVDRFDAMPRVILIPGVGAVCAGADVGEAGIVRDITARTLSAKTKVAAMGTYEGLAEDRLFDMEYFTLQHAKLRDGQNTVRGNRDEQPLRRSVALVTGAAGAVGAGVCRELLDAGCHVVVSDLHGDPLTSLAVELKKDYGDRVFAVPLDVTDPGSVGEGFDRAIQGWGGVDLVVANAGAAHVSSIAEMDTDAFRRLERVNIEGTLNVIAEAGRRFTTQGIGGDIVLISTKNVFAPGAKFGAYSATKAAAHQLARIASLELAESDVRVNMVSPDAVFGYGDRRSGLWAEVGPDRMRARGLDEAGLEEYYKNRNLLKAKVTAAHVGRAVLFFATHQTPTTGATIPVDGGLPDATPR